MVLVKEDSDNFSLVLSTLEGNTTEGRKLIVLYPPVSFLFDIKKILPLTLPQSCVPNGYYVNRLNKELILSITFASKNISYRDDIVSLSIYLHQKDFEEAYEFLLKKLVQNLQKMGYLEKDFLKNNLNLIYNAIKKEDDISTGKTVIKMKEIIHTFKMKLKKLDTKLNKEQIKGKFL